MKCKLPSFAVFLVLPSFLTGCLECSSADCNDGVEGEIKNLTAEGHYELSVESSKGTAVCEFTLGGPASGTGNAGAGNAGASGEGTAGAAGGDPDDPENPEASCSGWFDFSAGFTRSTLHFEIGTKVPSLRVHLRHEGETLIQKSYSLTYEKVAPNGEACGPVCEVAKITID